MSDLDPVVEELTDLRASVDALVEATNIKRDELTASASGAAAAASSAAASADVATSAAEDAEVAADMAAGFAGFGMPFSGAITFGPGSAALPSVRFDASGGGFMGLFASAPAVVGFCIGGLTPVRFDADGLSSDGLFGKARRNLIPRGLVVGGTANAIQISLRSEGLLAGQEFFFYPWSANTGSVTISIDGGAAIPCFTPSGATIPSGYIRTGGDLTAIRAIYNGSGFVLIRRDVEEVTGGNGRAVKYPYGRMICTYEFSSSQAINIALMGGFRSSEQTWTFPVGFSDTPVLTANAADLTAFGAQPTGNSSDTLGRFIWTAVTTQVAGMRKASLLAEGRWFI